MEVSQHATRANGFIDASCKTQPNFGDMRPTFWKGPSCAAIADGWQLGLWLPGQLHVRERRTFDAGTPCTLSGSCWESVSS